jgi:hypothetical protein
LSVAAAAIDQAYRLRPSCRIKAWPPAGQLRRDEAAIGVESQVQAGFVAARAGQQAEEFFAIDGIARLQAF